MSSPRNSTIYIGSTTPVSLQGHNFLGTTLWFRDDPLNECHAHRLSDFNIPGFRKFVYKENVRALEFITRDTRPGDIVVTHHIPTNRSVGNEWKTNLLNRFFVCDVERELFSKQPRLVVHGHTHESFHYHLGDTEVICNPLGYPHQINRFFDSRLIVEI